VPDGGGGKTPPLAPLASGATVPRARRRAYGLRAMEA
jgi:hypothetical protein